jgi:hypothetical protein
MDCRVDKPVDQRSTRSASGASNGSTRGLPGTWRPVEYSIAGTAGLGRSFPFGVGPSGYLVYDLTGHVMFEVMRAGSGGVSGKIPRAGADSGDLRGLLQSFAGFFGTYTVDESTGSVTHRLEGELPSRAGAAEVATPYRIRGDTLIMGRDSGAKWLFVRVHAK